MTPSNSFTIRGPFRSPIHKGSWTYELLDDGEIVADVLGSTQQAALETALLLAAAPLMADVLEDSAREAWSGNRVRAVTLGNAFQESQGIACSACDTLGQPSHMVFCPASRPYHEACVPPAIKEAIAKEDAAAGEECCKLPHG
jgi:hypothetical protein